MIRNAPPRSADRGVREVIEAVKIEALAKGLRITDSVLTQLGGRDALTIHEYATTGGITLELDHAVLVNAPFDEPFCADSRLLLSHHGDGLTLSLDDTSAVVPVTRVLPLPGYLDTVDAEGRPISDTAMSHADRIRLSPIVGCAYNCSFCDLGQVRYCPRPVDQILTAIDVAIADPQLPPRHVLISGGSPAKGAKHQAYFEDVCRQITRHVRAVTGTEGQPWEVDVMMSATPNGPVFVEQMVAAGVTGFSLNLEVYADEAAHEHLALKHRFARPHLEAMIRRAVELLGWGNGRVRSLIIPGLESPEETLAGVEWLAAMGCSPVLSPFRPARGTPLADRAAVSPAVLTEILAAARAIVECHGVVLGPRCRECQHNTLSFPWDIEGLAEG